MGGRLDLKKPATTGSGGSPAKVVSTATGALVAGVAKTVLFDGGATFANGDYILQVQDANLVVLIDTLEKGDAVGTAGSEKTSFTIMVLTDLPSGLTIVAVGS